MSSKKKETTRTATARIPNLMTMAPAPCRLIHVEVFKNDDGSHFVSWDDVIGFLCLVETAYEKRVPADAFPRGGATHAEMVEQGWTAGQPLPPQVWPVVAGHHERHDDAIRVLHEVDRADNSLGSTIVPCEWPREQDLENAIRIGKEYLAGGAKTLGTGNSSSLDSRGNGKG